MHMLCGDIVGIAAALATCATTVAAIVVASVVRGLAGWLARISGLWPSMDFLTASRLMSAETERLVLRITGLIIFNRRRAFRGVLAERLFPLARGEADAERRNN